MVIWICAYLCVGLVLVSIFLVYEWKVGEDYTVGDIPETLVVMVIWPILLIFAVLILIANAWNGHASGSSNHA